MVAKTCFRKIEKSWPYSLGNWNRSPSTGIFGVFITGKLLANLLLGLSRVSIHLQPTKPTTNYFIQDLHVELHEPVGILHPYHSQYQSPISGLFCPYLWHNQTIHCSSASLGFANKEKQNGRYSGW